MVNNYYNVINKNEMFNEYIQRKYIFITFFSRQ